MLCGYKQTNVEKTSFEKDLEPILTDGLKVGVFTNEFDLYMFRLFFPNVKSVMNEETDIVYTEDEKLIDKYPIVILKKDGKHSIYKNHEKFPLSINEISQEEENKLTECTYVCTLFPPLDVDGNKVDYSKLKITTVGVYSVTPYKWNNEIGKEIEYLVSGDSPLTILDATACVGGDSIGFGLRFKSVVSVEKDKTNYEALVNNVNVYGLKNIVCLNQSFAPELLNTYKPKVVYFDPPWGGKSYMEKESIELYLDGKNIKDIIKEILKNSVELVVLKVPLNFNEDGLEIIITRKKEFKKFNVLFLS